MLVSNPRVLRQSKPQYHFGRIATAGEMDAARELLHTSFSAASRRDVNSLLQDGAYEPEKAGGRKHVRKLGKPLNIAVYEDTDEAVWPVSSISQHIPLGERRCRIVACLLAQPSCSSCVHIIYAATHPEHRKRGLMRSLIEHVESLGLPIIVHAIEHAEPFWHKLGRTETVAALRLNPRCGSGASMSDTRLLVSPADLRRVTGDKDTLLGTSTPPEPSPQNPPEGIQFTSPVTGEKLWDRIFHRTEKNKRDVCLARRFVKRRRTKSGAVRGGSEVDPDTEPHVVDDTTDEAADTPSSSASTRVNDVVQSQKPPHLTKNPLLDFTPPWWQQLHVETHRGLVN